MPEPPYTDDTTIRDDAKLLRRVPPHHFVIDPKREGGLRASSAAFDDDEDGPMSVYLEEILTAGGRHARCVLAGHKCFALATISAGSARAHGQKIVRNPQPSEPAHTLVCEPKPKAVQKALERASRWVIRPLVTLHGDIQGAAGDLIGENAPIGAATVDCLRSCVKAIDAIMVTNANRTVAPPSVFTALQGCRFSLSAALSALSVRDPATARNSLVEASDAIGRVIPVNLGQE
jgi:hypothetical protein